MTLPLLIVTLVQNVLAANDPGHDTLYILKTGDNLTGSLNVSSDLNADMIRAATLIYGDQLDIRANGTIFPVVSRPALQADANNLYLDSTGNIYLATRGGTAGIIQIGLPTGSSVILNVSGSIKQQGVAVCLANGTNCLTGTSTGGNITTISNGAGISVTNPTGPTTTIAVDDTVCRSDGTNCKAGAAEADPLWSGNSSTAARAGTCPEGEVVQNTTTGGVQCVAVGTGNGNITGSGTSNYIPKWTGTGTQDNSAIYDSSGNIAIGTTSAAGKLRVYNGAILIDGTTGNTPTSGSGTRMMWVPAKGAFRAGAVAGSNWDNANIGTNTIAMGYNTLANGSMGAVALGYGAQATGGFGATALGYGTLASGSNAPTALGYGTTANGNDGATALGDYTTASGNGAATALGFWTTASGNNGATAFGEDTLASGSDGATAFGYYPIASGNYGATAFGRHTVTSGNNGATAFGAMTIAGGDASLAAGIGTSTTAEGAISIGSGQYYWDANYWAFSYGEYHVTSYLNNTIPNSLMVGFNSTIPTLFVNGSAAGINTITPTQTLDINGTVSISGATYLGNSKCPSGQYLTADTTTGLLSCGSPSFTVGYQSSAAGWTNTTSSVSLANAAYNISAGVLAVDNTNGRIGIGDPNPAYLFTVGKSTAGGTNSFVLSNTDNSNGASHARQVISTGGGSSGDPYLLFDISGMQGWSIGMDNSDADKLKIDLGSGGVGSSTILTIQANGNVGIGTSSPGKGLDVNATSRFSGNQTWTIPSTASEVCFERFVGTTQNYTRCINASGSITERFGSFPVN